MTPGMQTQVMREIPVFLVFQVFPVLAVPPAAPTVPGCRPVARR
ncbi:hypothetical protein AB0G77_39115 [Streptomyces hygroscopicus]